MRDWWTEQERKAFNERARPLISQYGELEPLLGQRINGELTFAENLADLTGWSMAYRAYRRSLKGRSTPVIGRFTGDQRFFLALAQMRRSKLRDEVLQRILLTDNHSPMEYRVNGALRNMSEFYAAFGVQPGDAMFLPPERRVKVW
jgi:putative endopeptidase